MNPTKKFLCKESDEIVKNISQKHYPLKKSIVAQLSIHHQTTIAELAEGINSSIPTTTKLVEELISQKIIKQKGKAESRTGRRATLFGLADTSLHFMGIEIDQKGLANFAVTDIHNDIVVNEPVQRFDSLEAYRNPETLLKIVQHLLQSTAVDKESLLGLGIAMPAWVNTAEGSAGSSSIEIAEYLKKRLGIEVVVESRARASLHAECVKESIAERNIIYLHIAESLSIGIAIEGELYYGQSGFAGEFGHAPIFDNEIICECGRKGCLQSEVSGVALCRKLASEIERGANSSLRKQWSSEEEITISEIIAAAHANDSLSIEMIGKIGSGAGRAVASILSLLNPEMVIIGGELSEAGDYLTLPLKGAINRYSHTLLYSGTKIRTTKMNRDIAALGAAMLIRNKILEL